MTQNHVNSLGGFQNSANDCFNSIRDSGDGGNSNSGQGLEMMRSDGSLCIMEALSRSHRAAEHWPQRPFQSDGGVQQHSLLIADQLSRLTGNAGAGDQQMTASHSHFDMQNSSAETRDGPKLEDFLGGASLGGQYSDREAQQQQLNSLYYTTGNPAAANYGRDTQSRINVNLPYSHAGGGSLHDVPSSYHVAYGGVQDQSSLSNPHNYDHPHARAHQELQESNLLAGNRMHAQNLMQAALDQSATVEMLSDCALQLPQGGSPNPASDEYGLKTWLRHQAAAGKAGGSLNVLAPLQPLTLSMSAASHPSSGSTPVHGASHLIVESPTGAETCKRGAGKAGSKEPSPRKSIDTFGQRTSVYRGVTRHRWTGRYEAHLWDNSCRKEGQTRKGRQVYLGGYDKEDKAARAYDLAALKYWGPSTTINFPLTTYEAELEEMKNMSRQEYVASLRRKSSGFSRGASMYRGVTRHHQHGRWQARIGRVAGNKDLYLGTYSTQEEAAEAYDIAAIKFRGINAVTNFNISRYDTARIQQAAVNGHHGQEGMKTTKDVELAAAMSAGVASAHAAQSRAHTEAHALSQSQVAEEEHHHSLHSAGPPAAGSQLTTECLSSQAAGLSKNLHEWQLLYQQQAQHQARNSWGTSPQEDGQRTHLHGFGDSMRAPIPNSQSKFPSPTNGMLLRNLMGLEALPQDHNKGAGESSCSANQALLGHGMPSSGSMISSSAYQGGADQRAINTAAYNQSSDAASRALNSPPYQSSDRGYQQQQQQGSVERGAVDDSPKNSVGESEEASSKSSAYDPVLQGGVMYMSPGSQGKLNSFESTNNALSPWISSNAPGTVQGHMGSSPIFAHSWTE